MTASLAHAILYGAAGWGVVNIVADAHAWATRRRHWARQVDAELAWRRQLRANPVGGRRPQGPPRAMRSTDR